jgi:BirA family transcriptional regulator, biotin operon repressor / biotin---[acetyl-CoA-carboxylase] ligase
VDEPRSGNPVLSRIRIVERTGSTNADLIADDAAAEGDWLVALVQDDGRGRQGRAWEWLKGNFAGSALVRLRAGDPPAQTLSLAAGMALIDAIEVAAPDRSAMLKWPNDVLLDGGKLAGILLERAGDRVVVGFGVNLAGAPAIPGRPTAALDGTVAPQAFAPLLAASVARWVERWRADPASLPDRWLARAHPIGSALTVHLDSDHSVSGRFEGLGEDGALLLRTASGAIETIRAGDVSL